MLIFLHSRIPHPFPRFTDGWVYRVNGTAPDGPTGYASNHWTIAHNALDGYATNDAAVTGGVGFPLKSYVNDGGWDPLAGCEAVSPCSCAVSTDHTAINCSTVAGAGAGKVNGIYYLVSSFELLL